MLHFFIFSDSVIDFDPFDANEYFLLFRIEVCKILIEGSFAFCLSATLHHICLFKIFFGSAEHDSKLVEFFKIGTAFDDEHSSVFIDFCHISVIVTPKYKVNLVDLIC